VDLDELIAREAVRDLVARYNANADAGRFDEVVALFATDGVLELPAAQHVGRAAIAEMFRGVQGRVVDATPAGAPPYLRHLTSTLQIDLDDGEHAHSRCYFEVLMAHGLDHWGRYLDDFVRLDGTWRFARRRAITDGHHPDSPLAG
jgi:3-phenylpropionate/cinnamic acid dioxygenase small subunit